MPRSGGHAFTLNDRNPTMKSSGQAAPAHDDRPGAVPRLARRLAAMKMPGADPSRAEGFFREVSGPES
jgi:hypothetical protein